MDRIGQLYHLHAQRRQAAPGSDLFTQWDLQLREAVQRMADARKAELADTALAEPSRAVLQSMHNHWPGLTVFVEQPSLPMDNNTAERALRQAVVARKNFYGSGSQWSGQLAATLFSLMMTVKLHQLNPRTWLSAYLNACAANGNRAPAEVSAFLPWSMDEQQLAAMRAAVPGSAPDHMARTALRPPDVRRDDVHRRSADHGDVHHGAPRPVIAPERRAGYNSS